MDQILKHKIGQMIVAGFPSPYVDAQARRLVEDYEVELLQESQENSPSKKSTQIQGWSKIQYH